MRSGCCPEICVVGLEQHRRGGGALDVAAHLDELPALAVAHGRVGDALELVDRLHHRLQKLASAASISAAVPRPADRSASPGRSPADTGEFSRCHCSVEICSRTCREFSRAEMMQRQNRGLVSVSKVRACVSAYGVAVHSTSFGLPSACSMRCQRRSALVGALVQHQVQVDVQQARRVLGALEVAAHPVQDCRRRVTASACSFH